MGCYGLYDTPTIHFFSHKKLERSNQKLELLDKDYIVTNLNYLTLWGQKSHL